MTDKMPPLPFVAGVVWSNDGAALIQRGKELSWCAKNGTALLVTEESARTYAAAVAAPLVEALESFTKSSYIRHQHPIRFAKAVAALAAYKEQQ
jgi:hypothetical protein